MSTLSRQRRARRRKTLLVESLEPRVVLDGHLAAAVADVATEPDSPTAIERFESEDELREYLVAGAVKQWEGLFGQPTSPWRYPFFYEAFDQVGWPTPVPRNVEFNIGDVTLVNSPDVEVGGFNVQVGGVDEGDIVKTDGEFIYIAANDELSIIDARNPTELAVVSQIELEHGLRELYVTGDRLTTITTEFSLFPRGRALLDIAFPYDPQPPQTVVTVYDITDPSAPGWISETSIDGSLVSSRRIDDLVYVVTNQHLSFPELEFTCNDEPVAGTTVTGEPGLVTAASFIPYPLPPTPQQSCVYESEETYVARISDTIVESTLPHYEVTQVADVAIGGLLNSPEEIYKPITDAAHNLSSITVVDVNASTDGIVSAATVPTKYGTSIYASSENIYLAATVWNSSGGETQLQQFALGADGSVELAAVGTVAGTLLNQFSMDEHESHLRVVTTSGWGDEARNRLFVLAANEQQLEIVGEIDSIAPGERVFAARFLGDRGFVVTFRQIDPLFTIDLSDPTAPTIEGELEIPGFSDYLHPISEDLLLGIGQDGADWRASPQISLFDVSDFTAPERIGQFVFDAGSWTEARYNHHAFSYFPDSQLVVIPFRSRGHSICLDFCSPTPRSAFQVLRVDATSETPFEVLGTIEHDSHALRSLRIGDTLFTVSTESIKATELQNPEALLGEVQFGPIAWNDHYSVDVASQGEVLTVLENDRGSSNTIIEVSSTTEGGSVAITDDGQTIVYAPPTDAQRTIDTFTYEIDNGVRTDTATVHVALKNESARERMKELAVGDLAELLQIETDEIEVRHISRETWPDTCLGIESDEGCGDLPTPGFAVTLKTDGGRFNYRTDEVSQVAMASAHLRMRADHVEVSGEEAVTLDVLANDGSHAGVFRIIEVGGAAGEVTISDDGKSLSYTPQAGLLTDSFRYTVELANGVTDSSRVSVLVLPDSLEDIEQAAVRALAEELEVDPESIEVVASEVIADHLHHYHCQTLLGPDGNCGYAVRVALQWQNRFYVYHAQSVTELQLNRVFEPALRDDHAGVELGDSVAIDVLRNDHLQDALFPALQANPSVITAVSDSREGATITFDDTSIQYTPPEDFIGTDLFTYSVGELQAEVSVHVDGFTGSELLVAFRPEVVDADGNELSVLSPGSEAVLQIFVEDLRPESERVFTAFMDVEFDPVNVAEIVDIEYGPIFGNIQSGDTQTPGLIDELGAGNFDDEAVRDGEQLLARVTFIAGDEGTLTFATSPPDVFPANDILLLGSNSPVPLDRIDFGTATVEIGAGMHNVAMAEDTNGDGVVSAIDALRVINFLNVAGTQTIQRATEAFADSAGLTSTIRSFLDVNNDGHISPLDALLCINRIESQQVGLAEGEATVDVESLSSPSRSDVPGIAIEVPAFQSVGDSALEAIAKVRADAGTSAQPDVGGSHTPAHRANAERREALRAADEVFSELQVREDAEQGAWWLTE